MVDILDMEDIFEEHIYPIVKDIWLNAESICKSDMQDIVRKLAKKITKEVEDFVEGQQTITCANCMGYKFKDLDSTKR